MRESLGLGARYVIANTSIQVIAGADWGKGVMDRCQEVMFETTTPVTPDESVLLSIYPPSYIFFLNWPHKVEDTALLDFHECVNFHCTRLPYGRGGSPIENLILAGHTETVITAHRMTAEFDAGPIYGTSGWVSLSGTKADILQRFVEPCAQLIKWIATSRPIPKPQQGKVTHFKRLSDEDYKRFWAKRDSMWRRVVSR